jgi:hypothetical protein
MRSLASIEPQKSVDAYGATLASKSPILARVPGARFCTTRRLQVLATWSGCLLTPSSAIAFCSPFYVGFLFKKGHSPQDALLSLRECASVSLRLFH